SLEPDTPKLKFTRIDTRLIKLISTHQCAALLSRCVRQHGGAVTMFTPKGKFSWYELMTSDTKAAGKFYSDVVGWTTQEMPSGDTPYTTFNIGGLGMAGMLQMTGHIAWVGYISVDDVDAHVEKIVE